MNDKVVNWNGGLQPEAVKILSADGGMIVCPTKVGYIIMTSDAKGLERKFDAKQRNRNKPGVVLCGSLAQLKELAQLNPEIEALYQQHWDKDGVLSEEKFKHWAYQATNQAIIARLKAICNQVSRAQELGHTYITDCLL